MNISPWTIYLIGQADNLQQLFVAITVVGCVICFIMGLVCVVTDGEVNPFMGSRPLLFFAVALAIIGLTLATLTPSSKTLAAMYIIPKIANNEQLQKDGGDIYKLAVEFAKDKLAVEFAKDKPATKGEKE